jgi:hypothetical protein
LPFNNHFGETMLRHLTITALAAMFAARPALAQNATAQVSGVIADEYGRPLPGAHIVITRRPHPVQGDDGKWRDAPGETPFSAQAASDATGKYQLPQLPAGDYDLCMHAPGYLATCDWTGWQRATVAASQALAQGTVQLTKAVKVTIRINDPHGLLGSANHVSAPFAAGVREQSGRFIPPERLPPTASATRCRSQFRTPRPSLCGSTVGGSSSPTPRAPQSITWAQFPFQVPTNGTPPSYTFTITGEASR